MYCIACQCAMFVVDDCLLSHSPPYLVTAAKCLLIGQHTQLYERAVDILNQAVDVSRLLTSFTVHTVSCGMHLVPGQCTVNHTQSAVFPIN